MSIQIDGNGGSQSHPLTHMEEKGLYYECPLCRVRMIKSMRSGFVLVDGEDFLCEGTHVSVLSNDELPKAVIKVSRPPSTRF